MFNKVTKTFQYGQHSVTLETGEIARQASGAVMVSIEDTVVLATVVARKDAKPQSKQRRKRYNDDSGRIIDFERSNCHEDPAPRYSDSAALRENLAK